ncbi:MAG: AI-2E family transporter [Anaerolineae bacterium]|nr:MAG: AI-2E family transporter [Anaerolineae bacterium]
MTARWSKTTRYLSLIIVLAALVWLLSAIRALIGPLIIAALLAYVLNPGVTLITAHTRLGRRLAASLIYLRLLVGLVAILFILGPVVIHQASNLSLELQAVSAQLVEILDTPATFLGFQLPLDQALVELQELSSQSLKPERVFKVLQAATTNLGWILVTTYYLLRDWESLREWLIGLAPDFYQPDLRRLYQEIKEVWHAYLRSQLLLMLLVGLLTGLGAAAVGLRGAVVLGLLAAALDLIPSLGPTAATAIATIVAWFEGSSHLPLSNAWFAIVVLALYASVQLLEEIWLRPRVMSHTLRLHPGLVFVAVVGALALGGALVALIIVPLLGSAGLAGRYLHHRMLGLEPWPRNAGHIPTDNPANSE